jgi:hypothetical protein
VIRVDTVAPLAGAAVGEGTEWKEPLGQAGADVPRYTRYPDRSRKAEPSAFVEGAFQVRGNDAASTPAAAAITAANMSTAMDRRPTHVVGAVSARPLETLPLIAVCLLVRARD